MASVLGNSSRASGAQSGQVKCKLKRRRRRRSKRKGTTLQPLPVLLLWFLSSVSRVRAHLGGASERAAYPRAAPASCTAAPRRFYSANLEKSKTTNTKKWFMFRRAVGLKWRIVSAAESLVAAASIVVKKRPLSNINEDGEKMK